MRFPSVFAPPETMLPIERGAPRLPSLVRQLLALPRARPRAQSVSGSQALIELRGVPLTALPRLHAELRARLLEAPGVRGFQLNPYLRRVCFEVTPGFAHLPTLVRWVEESEAICRGEGDAAALERELPDDELLRLQRWVELLADSAGLGMGVILRALPFLPRGLGADAVVVLSLLKSQPRLRAPLDRRIGPERTDLLLCLCSSFCQGLSQRPLSSLVDVSHRVSALRELRARARLFGQRRGELFAAAADPHAELVPEHLGEPRPAPLPKGPLEVYGDRAWLTALGAFGFSWLTSRSLRRGGAALLGALPRPAHLGREIYANEVSRLLSERGTLVLAPDALRRLDRVDCLVIDAALLSHAHFALGRIMPCAELPQSEIEVHARSLFDPARPLAVQRGDGFELGPLPLLSARLDEAAHARARELHELGSLVLGLGRGDTLCALLEVRIGASTGVEDLLEAAHRGGLRIAIAAKRGHGFSYHGSLALEVIAGGDELAASLRSLQQGGHAVCYVGLGPSPALACADCAVAVRDPNAPTPWAAHVICEPDLEGLHTLLRACLLARGVSKRSANLALGAAAVGTLASAVGKGGPSQRVMLVVNVASLCSMLNALQKAAPLRGREALLRPDPTPWHALDSRAVLARLRSEPGGLSHAQAAERRHGQPATRRPAWLELGAAISEELQSPLAPLLAAGAGLSALVGSTLDAGLVAGVGGINAVVGGVQRYRAERAIRRLTQPVRQQVRVRRGGATVVLDSEELVPGDLLLFTPGEEVPADCRILESNELEVDSSIITGESLPSARDAAPSFEANLADRGCMLYAGTRVVGGSATAVVVAVGDRVEARRGAQAKDGGQNSGVEARLRELMQLTGPVATGGGLAVVLAGLLRGRRAGDLIETGVSMAVAALPEGLPLLASAAQLSTAERLSRGGALVRNARCIEPLGRVDVICLDKTGTLTAGQLELHLVSDGTHALPLSGLQAAQRRVLGAALRASTSGGAIHRDPTDDALLRAAEAAGVDRSEGHTDLRPHAERPFEAARGYHAVLSHTDRGMLLSVKGVPERLLARCSEQLVDGARVELAQAQREALLARVAELAAQGLRVLAVAERELDHGGVAEIEPSVERLCFCGLLAFRDATRAQAASTVERLRAAGIEVVMLTGDHQSAAHSIAEELGVGRGRASLSGGALGHLSDEQLRDRVERYGVFARVTPSQKVRIVRALQARGHVVAMVGDGANDAPALRIADVGVAIGQGCAPVARAAADIVLADAALERLLDCIFEARAMWLSVHDAVSILLGGNLGEIGFTVAAGLVSGRPPLSPRQLLLVNVLTDIAPAMAIALRQPSESVYAELQNGHPDELLQARLNRTIAIRALSTGLGASWAWVLGRVTGGKARASTMALCALVGSQLGQTLLARGKGRSVTWTALGSAAALAAIVQTPGVSHLLGCRPLGPLAWAGSIASSAAATLTSAGLSAAEARFQTWWKTRNGEVRAEVVMRKPVRIAADAAARIPALRRLVN